MSAMPHENSPDQELVGDIKRRQRNTTWPDVMTNASSADALMWHGSRHITKIQRVGIGLFGLLFLLGSISIANNVYSFWPAYFIAAAFAAVGCKLVWNSIRRNDPSKDGLKSE